METGPKSLTYSAWDNEDKDIEIWNSPDTKDMDQYHFIEFTMQLNKEGNLFTNYI